MEKIPQKSLKHYFILYIFLVQNHKQLHGRLNIWVQLQGTNLLLRLMEQSVVDTYTHLLEQSVVMSRCLAVRAGL